RRLCGSLVAVRYRRMGFPSQGLGGSKPGDSEIAFESIRLRNSHSQSRNSLFAVPFQQFLQLLEVGRHEVDRYTCFSQFWYQAVRGHPAAFEGEVDADRRYLVEGGAEISPERVLQRNLCVEQFGSMRDINPSAYTGASCSSDRRQRIGIRRLSPGK